MIRVHISFSFFIIFEIFATLVVGLEFDEKNLKPPCDDCIQIITTSDGSTIIGKFTNITANTVEFLTDLGLITIPRNRITSINTVPVSSIRGGVYWFPDPNTTRLFFAPTGRMLPKGKGYIADYLFFFPSFNYGVTSNLSLGGGCSIFPTGNMSNQIYFFTPKIGLKRSKNLNIAAGALVLKIPDIGDEDTPLVSVLYGTGTWGSTDQSLTCGFGYGMVDRKFGSKPLIVIGGEKRLTRRLAFVTENWMIPGVNNVLLSYGIRFLTEKFTTDFALLNTTGGNVVFPGIPYIDFVYNF
ncbi:MAG: hypothetical protein JXB48_10860 [Candidatus Latescibacteria bacterium]|nr:hypothetical protein [Candidatus Latescibacterota bacterium]